MCEEVISTKIHAKNVLDVLILADSYNALSLKAQAINFLINNRTDSMKMLSAESTRLSMYPTLIEEIFQALSSE